MEGRTHSIGATISGKALRAGKTISPFTPRTPGRVIIIATILLWLIYGIAGGCYAQRVPPQISVADEAIVASGPLPYSVLVVHWDTTGRGQNAEAYAQGAYEWLMNSEAFRSVRRGTLASDSADLVATSGGAYCNTAVIPLLTGLTLGLYPTIWTETDCKDVVFRRFGAAPGADSLKVEHRESGTAMMGWLAVPVGALPGWSHSSSVSSRRGRERARLAILKQREALAKLAGR